MAKERLHYIDVAKGLLILMVVWGHYELICRLCFGINDPTVNMLDSVESFWVSFFMPAFFFFTGYCTSFRKRFIPFFVQGVKILIVPAVIINYTANIIEYMSWGGVDMFWIVKTTVKSFLLTCAGEWFIPSLFLSRLIVWALVRIKRVLLQLVIALIMFCSGVVLYDCFPQIPEIWSYKHALMMIIFMIVGNILKNKELIRDGGQWIYMVLLIIVLFSRTGVPYITNRVSVALWQIPIVLVLALSGISFIVYVSKKINCSRVLEFLGRNSLVIYLAHFIFYKIYLGWVSGWFEISPWVSATLFFSVIIVNVLSCCLLAMVLNTRYFKWILGKF